MSNGARAGLGDFPDLRAIRGGLVGDLKAERLSRQQLAEMIVAISTQVSRLHCQGLLKLLADELPELKAKLEAEQERLAQEGTKAQEGTEDGGAG